MSFYPIILEFIFPKDKIFLYIITVQLWNLGHLTLIPHFKVYIVIPSIALVIFFIDLFFQFRILSRKPYLFSCHVSLVSFNLELFLALPLSFMPLAFLVNTGQLFHWIYSWRFGFLCCFLVIILRLPILGCYINVVVSFSWFHI